MNLSRIIEHWAGMAPAKTAFHYQGEQLGYADLWRHTEAATANLAALGVAKGERVAWLGLNHPDFIAFLMACARLGAIAVPLNFRLAAPELAEVLGHAGVSRAFVDVPMRALGEAMVAATGIPLAPAESLAEDRGAPVPVIVGDDSDPVMIVYTSGTTGRPKGAVHTQANLLWNIASAVAAQDITSSELLLNALPMFHVGGLNIQTLPVLASGGSVVLHARFDPGAWLADVAKYRPTISLLVPATIRAVLDHPDWATTDLSSLRFLNAGSSTVPLSMIEAFHVRGVPVGQVYGATETGPVSIVLRSQDAVARAGSAGKPALHVEVRLVKRDGSDAATDETGEIWLKGGNVVAGYWKDPGNSAFAGGWFRTGDLARIDAEGFFWVVGRSKDMIISGGENIYPAELENVLADCPDILESAVIGRADAKWGEMAVAVVVPKPGTTLDAERVRSLFEGRLARYKHPREVVFAESLPKTALGKVQKDLLKERLAAS
ncbi:MAG: acyl-CoA synthetase [Burkholderiales bacterium]